MPDAALLYTGHALDILQSLPESSIQTCITSPPYWGLRNYSLCPCRGMQDCEYCGGTGQIGGMDFVYDGNPGCRHEWVEYSRSGMSGGPSDKQVSNSGPRHAPSACSACSAWKGMLGLETRPDLYVQHLVEILGEVRRVLRDDGTLWIVIGDSYSGSGKGGNPDAGKQTTNAGSQQIGVLYGKTSDAQHVAAVTNVSRQCCAESGIRPKNLIGIPWRLAFALQDAGWYLRSDIIWSKPNCFPESVKDRCTRSHEYVFMLAKSERYKYYADRVLEEFATAKSENYPGRARSDSRGQQPSKSQVPGAQPQRDASGGYPVKRSGRNKRSVWEVSPEMFDSTVWRVNIAPFKGAHFATFPPDLILPMILAASDTGDAVLDPFSGSGTTGLVAMQNSREYIGIDANPLYNEIAQRRLTAAGFDAVIW